MKTALTALAGTLLAALAMDTPSVTAHGRAGASHATPLILEKNEGEKRLWRPIEGAKGWNAEPGLFILKIDPRNGGSSHMVFGTEDVPPGASIDRHRHPGADEILFLQNGTARVTLGDQTRDVHGGATVFIPSNTWISVTNTGSAAIHLAFVFSAPGFDDYMRAESVPEGQKVTPLTKAEDTRIEKKYARAVIYAQP